MRRELPVGIENFETIIRNNYYYVDKTSFLKPVLTSGSYVRLITRPRRFGKSLFMDMMRTFLSVNPEKPGDTSRQERLFAGLGILEDREFCERFMGRVPVLAISFKGIDREEFVDAYRVLADRLMTVAREHAYLLDSPKIDEHERRTLSNFLSSDFMKDLSNREDVLRFIERMAVLLARHHGRQVVLLVDEYDVPIAKAASYGYYGKMVEVIRGLLDPLKSGGTELVDNLPALGKIILTGCLRVSKESIFTGFNNPDVNSVCSEDVFLAECIGFTQKEVDDLLDHYGLSSRREVVKDWYDGYRFAGRELYCAWDVINFAGLARCSEDPLAYEPQNYWLNTSGNAVLLPFIDHLTKTDSSMMEDLVNGGVVRVRLNEQVSYADLEAHRSEDFWTLLLFSGYLTVAYREGETYGLKIPNREIRASFMSRIEHLFSPRNGAFVHAGEEIAKAALAGNVRAMQRHLSGFLERYVSIRDTATRAKGENLFHGCLIGMLGCAGRVVKNFRSNAEAGAGYADIRFTSADSEVGVVIELKDDERMKTAAGAALQQIHEKNYVQGLSEFNCRKVFAYGIAFHQKSCVVLGEELDLED